MADPQVVQIWLDKADEDFNFASASIREGNEFYYPVHWPVDYTKGKALKAKDAARDVAVAVKGLLQTR